MGRRVRDDADHPFVVGDPDDATPRPERHARPPSSATSDWLPSPPGRSQAPSRRPARCSASTARAAARVAPSRSSSAARARQSVPARRTARSRSGASVFAGHPRGVAQRTGDVKRSGHAASRRGRLDLGIPLAGGAAGHGPERDLRTDAVATRRSLLARRRALPRRGPLRASTESTTRHRLSWSFHPRARSTSSTRWSASGCATACTATVVRPAPRRGSSPCRSRLLGAWWIRDRSDSAATATSSGSRTSLGAAGRPSKWALLSGPLGGRRVVVARERRPERRSSSSGP